MYRYVFISKILAVFTIHIVLFTISGVCYGDRNQEGFVSDERLGEKSFYLSICDGLVSLDAQKADLREILTEISNKTKVVIEIDAGIEDSITTSFREIPLDEALKKITGNWAMVFLKEKGQNVEQLSKVVILADSQDLAKSKTDNHYSFKPPPDSPVKPVLPTDRSSSQKKSSASLTLTNEKTGLKSNVVPNELIVRFKKELSKVAASSLPQLLAPTLNHM